MCGRIIVYNSVHNTAQNSSANFPSYQTIIATQIMSNGGACVGGWRKDEVSGWFFLTGVTAPSSLEWFDAVGWATTGRYFTCKNPRHIWLRIKVSRPTWYNIGHFGDVLLSWSLGLVLKKLNLPQQKQTFIHPEYEINTQKTKARFGCLVWPLAWKRSRLYTTVPGPTWGQFLTDGEDNHRATS